MRRLRRILFNGLTVLSLLLCMAFAAVWIRGGWLQRADFIVVTTLGGNHWVFSSGMGLHVLHVSRWPESAEVYYWGYDMRKGILMHHSTPVFVFHLGGAHLRQREALGFTAFAGELCILVSEDGSVLRIPPGLSRAVKPQDLSPLFPFHELSSPYFTLTALFGVGPLIVGCRLLRMFLLRRSRASHSLCSICGYDLRATPNQCPECGTIVSGSKP